MSGRLGNSLLTVASNASNRMLKQFQQSSTRLRMLSDNARNDGSTNSKGAVASPPAKAASRVNFGPDNIVVLSYKSHQEMLDSMILAPVDEGMSRLGRPASGRASKVDYIMPKPLDNGRSQSASLLMPNTSQGATDGEIRYV